jgi:DNA end-binding protein Ku
MPRSIWSGAISFGLVNVPVKLFSAVSKKGVRFHQLNSETGARIQQKRVDPSTGEEVPYEAIVKGYEIGPDRYVVVTPDELEALDPPSSRTIDIEDFVPLEEIDPLYWDQPYLLAPAPGGAKAYRLLVEAMRESGKVAIARFVLRSKQHLAAIRAVDDHLVMATMLYPDEVVDPGGIDELEAAEEAQASEREVAMARQLIESLSTDFDPARYRDEYRDALLGLIERKASGEEVAVQPVQQAPKEVPDLMAALEASIAAVKQGDGTPAESERPRARKGKGKGADAEPAPEPEKKKPARRRRQPAAK